MNEQVHNEEIRQLVSFVIGEEEFGVDIMIVQEIIRFIEVTHVPNSPEYVEGVINLRGKIIPVIDLRKRFGHVGIDRNSNTRIIVVELSDKVVGFLVDRVKEVIRISSTIIENTPNLVTNVKTRYITGVAKLEDRLLILLDLESVLSDNEAAELFAEEAVAA